MKLKKFILFGLMIAIILLLMTGCVKFEMFVNVNPDKSADVNVTLLVNSMIAGMTNSEGSGINLSEMKTIAEKAGYSATNQKEGDMIGYKFTKHFKNISELSTDSSSNTDLKNLFKNEKSDTKIFTINRGLFQDTYIVNLDMNLDSINPPADNGNDFVNSIAKTMMAQMDFKFKTKLPIKTISNNASTESEDGKMLEWQLVPGQDNKIKMEFKVLNVTNIIFVSVCFLILLIILFFVIRHKNKLKSIEFHHQDAKDDVYEVIKEDETEHGV